MQEILDLSKHLEKASEDQLLKLRSLIGDESFKILHKYDLSVFVEPESSEKKVRFVVPIDARVLTISHSSDFGVTDISFEFTADYNERKRGNLSSDASYARNSDKLQSGTLSFMRFLAEFVGQISDTTYFRLIADGKRTRLYESFLSRINKPNIHLVPKVIDISLD